VFIWIARGWYLGARAPPHRDQNSIKKFKFFSFKIEKSIFYKDFFKNKKLGTPSSKELIWIEAFDFNPSIAVKIFEKVDNLVQKLKIL